MFRWVAALPPKKDTALKIRADLPFSAI